MNSRATIPLTVTVLGAVVLAACAGDAVESEPVALGSPELEAAMAAISAADVERHVRVGLEEVAVAEAVHERVALAHARAIEQGLRLVLGLAGGFRRQRPLEALPYALALVAECHETAV